MPARGSRLCTPTPSPSLQISARQRQVADRSRIGFIMGDADWVCPYCNGEYGLPRTSENGGSCTKRKCRQKHTAFLREDGDVPVVRAATGGSGGMPTPKNCYEVFQVLGHAYQHVREMGPYERRNECDPEHEDMVYQVRARFGEDEDDGGVVDTQWVLLSDLLEHVSLQTALDRELDKYARGLQANARRAREALRRT